MTTLSQRYPVGSHVTTVHGVATVLGHDERALQLRVLADVEEWVNVESVLTVTETPDLNGPDSIEAFLDAVNIHQYDKPPPKAARNQPCDCDCGARGGCYRVTGNGFHMTNTHCRCGGTCACL